MSVLLLAWQAAALPRLAAVRSEPVDGRPAVVVVVTGGALTDVPVRRDGSDVVVDLAVTAPVLPNPPSVAPPLRSLRIERSPTGVRLRIGITPGLPYDVRVGATRCVLVFGSRTPVAPPSPRIAAGPSPVPAGRPSPSPAPVAASTPSPDAAAPAPSPPAPTASTPDLYRGLFPPSGGPPGDTLGEGTDAPAASASAPHAERAEGLAIGIMTVRPSLVVSYADADVSVESPEPTHDRYLEARPAIGVEVPLRDGHLRLDYQTRLRGYSTIDEVNGASHEVNAELETPAGPSLNLRGQGHFAHGLLETREVDPGGEYFFQLGTFTRWEGRAGARLHLGSRFDVDAEGGIDDVDVAEDAAFFDYQRRSAGAALGIELGPGRRASLSYEYEQVPGTVERPEAESRVHALSAGIDGEIMPLLSGRASVGYTRRESPQAAPGGQTFTGLSFGARLKREFGRSSSLVLSADRGTELSNFEENAFYVMTSVQATLSVPLPFSFSGIVGGGYHVNRYLTEASALGEPRRDEIVGWLAGVGRSITRWAFVRADYRQDRRSSNIDAFDQRPHAFYVQVGLGYVGSPGGR